MAKEIVIFGTGQIAEVANFYFRHDSECEPVAFTVDREFQEKYQFCDLPVVAFEELNGEYPPERCSLFVAVSYQNLNRTRADKCAAARAAGYDLVSYVSSQATVWPGFEHGDNCFILEDNTIQPFARLGHNVTLWSGNHIGHHSMIEDNVFVSSHVVVSGNVVIGEYSFLGVNATIRDGVRVGPRNVIGAGAFIAQNTEEEGVYMVSGAEKSRVPSSRLRRI